MPLLPFSGPVIPTPVPISKGGTGSSTQNFNHAVTLVVAANNASAAEKAGADYVCDGTGDEVQINDAIGALPSQGGRIQLTSGQFNIANAIVFTGNNQGIVGAGIDATVIAQTGGANCNGIEYTGTTQLIFCYLEHFTLLGNYSGNTSGYGLYIVPGNGGHLWDFHARDVWFKQWPQDGVYISNTHGYLFDHALAEYNQGNGYTINNDSSDLDNCRLLNSTILANGGAGISCGAPYVDIYNTDIAGNGTYGIEVNASNVTIIGNVGGYNSQNTSNTYDDIYVAGDFNTIIGNSFDGYDGAYQSRHNLNIASGSSNFIGPNRLAYSVSSSINDSGTNTIWLNSSGTQLSSFKTPINLPSGVAAYRGSNQLIWSDGSSYNTALGEQALTSLSSGTYNVAIGYASLIDLTTGTQNMAIGEGAMGNVTSGNYNVAIGVQALKGVTNGSVTNSVAIGRQALNGNNGTNNVGIGYTAGSINTGSGNVFLGAYAGTKTTSTSNTFLVNNIAQSNSSNDLAYSLLHGTFSGTAGSLSGQQLTVNGTLNVNGVFFPIQASTASAPAYVLGGMYFDTTLNKLRIGGASGWETVSSS